LILLDGTEGQLGHAKNNTFIYKKLFRKNEVKKADKDFSPKTTYIKETKG
jgi:hypothetical protein